MSSTDRLRPDPTRADYLHLRCLRAQLSARIRESWPEKSTKIDVVDLGCSNRPYEPLFATRAGSYVGVDNRAGEGVDVVACVESLPFSSASFDCVLCTQVLQYTANPSHAVAEMHRVLRPGGVLFLSTHGVGFVDRSGPDRWRWTHSGLRSLVDLAGTWQSVEVGPAAGVMSAGAYLVGGQIEFAAHHLGLPRLAAIPCLTLNALAWRADQAVRRAFSTIPPDASVNYLVHARR